MFCKLISAPLFLLFFLVLANASKAMHQDDLDEYYDNYSVTKKVTLSQDKKFSPNMGNLPISFIDLPEDMIKEIFNYLGSQIFLSLRATSKSLRERVDQDYWEYRSIIIRANSSSPALQEIKDLPCATVSLFFGKWEKKDIESLFSFKKVTHLHLSGLESWDFSTNELFNPSLKSYFCSCLKWIINIEDYSEPIFLNVASLDLSGSKIGAYGITSFVSLFKNLKTLNSSKNNIGSNTEGEAKTLANLTTLTSLDISHNEFSDTSIKEITQLKNLTSLDVSYNFISDSAVKTLKQNFPKLTQLINNEQKQKNHYSNEFLPSFHYPRPWPGASHYNYGLPYMRG